MKESFLEVFNDHFNQTNLPNQQKHGSKLIGRWQRNCKDGTYEVFAIWEYESYERYEEIETKIRSDQEHVNRVKQWYDAHGGRDFVYSNYILEVKNEAIENTVQLKRR